MTVLFKKIKKKIFTDNLTKNIFLVSSGAATAQIVKIVSQPVITRLFSPEEFGVLTIFTSIMLIFRFCTLRYEVAIPVALDDNDAINLIVLSLSFLGISVLVISLLLILYGEFFLSLLNISELYPIRFVIPIGLLLQCAFFVLVEWMYRKKHYKIVTKKTVFQSTAGNSAKILFGILNLGSAGLVVGNVIGESIASVPLLKAFIEDQKNIKRKKISFNSLKRVGKTYKAFPLYQTPSSLAIHGRNQLPVIFLGFIYGSQVAGYYGLANSIIKLPMTIVGQSVMNVFFAEIASIGKENPSEIKRISDKLLKQLTVLGILPMFFLFIFGPSLFSIIFGSNWTQAGVFARILSIYIFPNFVLSPISRIFEVFDKQQYKMLIDVISLIILLVTFIGFSIFRPHVYLMLTIYAIIMLIMYVSTYILSVKVLEVEIKKTVK